MDLTHAAVQASSLGHCITFQVSITFSSHRAGWHLHHSECLFALCAIPAHCLAITIQCWSWCRGAAEGQGLGNAFLSHIQAVDGIVHVLRAFEDAEVIHVEDRIDPVEDLEIIHG